MKNPHRVFAALFLSLFVLPLLVADIDGQDVNSEIKAINGNWRPISAELAGMKLSEVQFSTITLVIKDGNYTVQAGKTEDKGALKIDPAKKPKAMDIVGTDGPNKGKTLLAIYEIDKDSLRICYDLGGKNRPTEFATSKEKPYFLAVYRRAKS